MNSENISENFLRRYLLGELSEADKTRIEDDVFADAERVTLVRSVEDDLIDEYTRGELSKTERENFERMFFSSAERKKKIEFARTLLQFDEKNSLAAQKATKPTCSVEKSFWQLFSALFLKPQVAFGTLALLILLGGALIFFNSGKYSTELAEQKNANLLAPQSVNQTINASNSQAIINSSPMQPAVSPNVKVVPTDGKSNQNKEKNTRTEPTPKATPTPQVKAESAATFATLIFPLGMTRDGGGKALQLKLTSNVKNARLVFNVEKGDEYEKYQIEIKNSSGVVSQSNVSDSGNAIVVNVPTIKLSAGKYEAVLRGVTGNRSDAIGYYDFEVIKP